MEFTEEDLTPWFPANVKPVRSGVYLREWPGHASFSWFDGEEWGLSYDASDERAYRFAILDAHWKSNDEDHRWRGLKKPTFLRDLPVGAKFILLRTGVRYSLIRREGKRLVVKRDGGTEESSLLHHSCHVRLAV